MVWVGVTRLVILSQEGWVPVGVSLGWSVTPGRLQVGRCLIF